MYYGGTNQEPKLQRWSKTVREEQERWKCTTLKNSFDIPIWVILGARRAQYHLALHYKLFSHCIAKIQHFSGKKKKLLARPSSAPKAQHRRRVLSHITNTYFS